MKSKNLIIILALVGIISACVPTPSTPVIDKTNWVYNYVYNYGLPNINFTDS
jgi:hypothetical protein